MPMRQGQVMVGARHHRCRHPSVLAFKFCAPVLEGHGVVGALGDDDRDAGGAEGLERRSPVAPRG